MSFLEELHKPDILDCISHLSSDEVFTPPKLVNEILDTLPQELFKSPDTKFLDPCCKSGVFLREIAKRLIDGLADKIPNLEERLDHIFKNQLFGLAITELTGLLSRRSVYCSKNANGKFSICEFANEQGNIEYKRTYHIWFKDKCMMCGASKSEYDRGEEFETHAYSFIHTDERRNSDLFKRLKDMKFDVIIGNPPYQMETSGFGRQAKPIYNYFIEQAKKLNPRYITMIIPARWFAGGMNLEKFREDMLNDTRIRYITDFPNSHDCFPGVDVPGGICYFLWDRDNEGLCEFTTVLNGIKYTNKRILNEYSTFVRDNRGLNIVKKVLALGINNGKTLDQIVSPQKPFGLPTNYIPRENGVPCWFIQKIGLKYADINDINDPNKYLQKWKFIVPRSPIAGQTDFTKPVGFYYDGNTKIAKPGECCTESYIVLGAFDTEEEVISYKSYIYTKTVRFLLLQTVVSQDVLRKKFCFIPALSKYEGVYTDERLKNMWNLTDDEMMYIDSRIYNIGEDK